ncbi:MAG: pilus assembly protein PilM [Chitinispirillia bacterium]
MAKVYKSSVGIEYDSVSIRAARVSFNKLGDDYQYAIESVEDEKGDFDKGDKLVESLIKIKQKLSISSKDNIVLSIFGKQVYASQINFRNLPKFEFEKALRFEIRKNISFNFANSVIDYQILNTPPTPKKTITLIVTAVSNLLLNNYLKIMNDAGIKPAIIDVLPMVIANVFWTHEFELLPDTAYVTAYFSTKVCTIVIDGENVPFFTRNIYFPAWEIYTKSSIINEKQITELLSDLRTELRRSLMYYENTYNVSNFSTLYLIGEYAQSPEIMNGLAGSIGLKVEYGNLAKKIDRSFQYENGKFDLAIGLALRND